MMTKICALEGKIDHKDIADKFKTACQPCTLFPNKVMCVVCCLRISRILEALRTPAYIEPGIPADLIPNRVKEHREKMVQALPVYLQEYHTMLPTVTGKDWGVIARECGMCPVNTNNLDGGNESIKADEARQMKPVRT